MDIGQDPQEKLAALGHEQVRLHDLRRGRPEGSIGGGLDVWRGFELLAIEHYDVVTGSCE